MAFRIIGVILWGLSSLALAVDYTYFLRPHSLKKISSHPDGYVVEDRFGNTFALQFPDEATRHSMVATSLLMDLLGLANPPTLPTLQMRFSNGALWLQSDQLPPNAQFDRGTLTPSMSYRDKGPLAPNAYNAEQQISAMTVSYLLGIPPETGAVRFTTNGNYILAPGSRVFQDYSRRASLADYLGTLPYATYSGSTERSNVFLFHQNELVTRLEKLTEPQWEQIFRGLWTPSRKAELFRRVQTLRSEMLAFYKQSRLNYPVEALTKAVDTPPSHLLLPPTELGSAPARMDRLWAAYYSVGKLPSEEISELRRDVKLDDTRLCEVALHMVPTLSELPPQVNLNSRNVATLVVAANNDMEASDLLRLARSAKAQTMSLSKDEFPHGTRLTHSLVDKILKEAKRVNAKRIVVVELAGPPEVEAMLSAQGREVFIVDHHDYPTESRFQPFSSLEQVAFILGAKISPQSRAIAVGDAQFVLGTLELGVPKEMAYKGGVVIAPPPGTEFFEMRSGVLIYQPAYFREAKEFEAQETVKNYPAKHTNFLTLNGNGLYFSGEARLVRVLMEILEPYRAHERNFYSGGSHSRSGYVRVEIDLRLRDEIAAKFLKHLKENEELVIPETSPICRRVHHVF